MEPEADLSRQLEEFSLDPEDVRPPIRKLDPSANAAEFIPAVCVCFSHLLNHVQGTRWPGVLQPNATVIGEGGTEYVLLSLLDPDQYANRLDAFSSPIHVSQMLERFSANAAEICLHHVFFAHYIDA